MSAPSAHSKIPRPSPPAFSVATNGNSVRPSLLRGSSTSALTASTTTPLSTTHAGSRLPLPLTSKPRLPRPSSVSSLSVPTFSRAGSTRLPMTHGPLSTRHRSQSGGELSTADHRRVQKTSVVATTPLTSGEKATRLQTVGGTSSTTRARALSGSEGGAERRELTVAEERRAGVKTIRGRGGKVPTPSMPLAKRLLPAARAIDEDEPAVKRERMEKEQGSMTRSVAVKEEEKPEVEPTEEKVNDNLVARFESDVVAMVERYRREIAPALGRLPPDTVAPTSALEGFATFVRLTMEKRGRQSA